MDIVLGSASPRRKEILENLGLSFRIVVPKNEEVWDESLGFAGAVERLARDKAYEVQKLLGAGDFLVIAADTAVVCEGKVLGKPKDEHDAFLMLKTLSGKTHEVYTGYCVLSPKGEKSGFDRTFVTFSRLSDERIFSYIETKEPFDKAGAYAVQGIGALLVDKIEGDYLSVMGLPAKKVAEALFAVSDVRILSD